MIAPAPHPSPLLLNKALDPADYDQLREELACVDAHWQEGVQHPQRRWEYAMALHAYWRWQADPATPPMLRLNTASHFLDVGGAGSSFAATLADYAQRMVEVVDPAAGTVAWEQYLGPPVPVITCLSVIEHLAQTTPFVRQLAAKLLPGGLLVLTTDYWDCEGLDTAHFHWMRQRIYNRQLLEREFLVTCRGLGLVRYGRTDWTYPGPQVYDYSFFLLTLVRQPSPEAV